MEYVEQNCIFEHDGRQYEAGGAVVTPDFIIAYPSKDGVLSDWHGKPIGTWKIVATWKLHNSWYSDVMHQIEARVNGVTYTGRGAGVACIYKGKRKA